MDTPLSSISDVARSREGSRSPVFWVLNAGSTTLAWIGHKRCAGSASIWQSPLHVAMPCPKSTATGRQTSLPFAGDRRRGDGR